jgi:hypothetical protein
MLGVRLISKTCFSRHALIFRFWALHTLLNKLMQYYLHCKLNLMSTIFIVKFTIKFILNLILKLFLYYKIRYVILHISLILYRAWIGTVGVTQLHLIFI